MNILYKCQFDFWKFWTKKLTQAGFDPTNIVFGAEIFCQLSIDSLDHSFCPLSIEVTHVVNWVVHFGYVRISPDSNEGEVENFG